MDSWIDVEALQDGVNTEDHILDRGFQFKETGTGMRFPVGRIDLETLKASSSGVKNNGKITKRFILCKVAVGRAYNAADDFAKIAAIPDGYDSFVIDRERRGSLAARGDEDAEVEELRETLKRSNLEENSFDFIVKDTSQVRRTVF